jgi:argininosuccinate lyase
MTTGRPLPKIERGKGMSEKTWGGRFQKKTEKVVEKFTSSIDFDRHLYAYDIDGSIAHCEMLAKQQIITKDEAEKLIAGLRVIKDRIEKGEFEYDDRLEDIHMHIESRLAAEVGDVARKLHTARSRNDQIALDLRLYLKHESMSIINMLMGLRETLVVLAKQHTDTILPGYTHLQRAQPVLLAHHLLAYAEMFSRDTERMKDSLKRLDDMPLGTAALAGTTYPIDREYTAKRLNFSRVSENSIDSVADRDFVMEFLSIASICMVHLSRISEEMILWSSTEFNFIEIPDAFATGSSIMPQKKNPDVCELTRGKAGRVFGDLIAVLTMMKSLPMSYNRDMQEDKEPLFDAVDTLKGCIEVYTAMLPEIKFNKEVMLKGAITGYLNATEVADYLTSKGMPFREAHSCAGKIVAHAIGEGKEINELTLMALKPFSNLIEKDLFDVLTPEAMINRRKSYGGTGTKNVIEAIERAEWRLNQERDDLKQ